MDPPRFGVQPLVDMVERMGNHNQDAQQTHQWSASQPQLVGMAERMESHSQDAPLELQHLERLAKGLDRPRQKHT